MNVTNVDCQQAATYLGVSVKTIRRWAQDGKLGGKKVGTRGDWRFNHTELDRMVSGNSDSETAVHKVIDILESMTEAFVRLDENWRIDLVNEAFVRLAGVARTKLFGHDIWDVFPKDRWPAAVHQKLLLSVMTHRKTVHFVDYNAAHNVWFEIRAYPSGGGVSIFARDITEQKKAEKC